MSRRLPLLTAVVVGVLLTAGCRSDPGEPAAASSTHAVASPVATATVEPLRAGSAPGNDPDTNASLGDQGAWTALSRYLDARSIQPALLLARDDWSADDFAGSTTGMSAGLADRWRAAAASATAGGDPAAWSFLQSVTVCNLSDPGHRLALPPTGPVAVDRAIDDVTARMDPTGTGYQFTFTYAYTLRLSVDGTVQRFPVRQQLTERMVSSTPLAEPSETDDDPSHWRLDEVHADPVDVLASPQPDA